MKKTITQICRIICINIAVILLHSTALSVPLEILFQDRIVSGKVTSSGDDTGIPGVNILVKGTGIGTVTDVEGNYSLSIPQLPNPSLLFTAIGFISQEIAVSNQSIIDIELAEDVQALDEVIVVGYGTQKKSDFTGAVQRVDAQNFQTQPLTNLTEMLTGTVAGFNSNQGTTAEGGGSLEIRGPTSLGANNEPLIVLDGVIYNGNIGDINPNDIQIIDNLKDASSAAIFGSRSASGVLIVTTKKGRTAKPSIHFSSKIGVAGLTNHMRSFGPDGYLAVRGDLFRRIHGANRHPSYYDNPNNLPSGISVDQWMNFDATPTGEPEGMWLNRLVVSPIEQGNYRAGRITNWYDEIFQNGIRQDYDANISGGSENLRYYFSTGYTQNNGVTLGDKFNTFRSRVNIDADLSNFLKIGVNAQFADRDQGFETISLNQAIAQSPFTQIYGEDGAMLLYPNDDALVTNPFIHYTYRDRVNKSQSLFATLFGEVTLPLGFSYRVNFSNNFLWNRTYLFDPINTPRGLNLGGYGERSNNAIYEWMVDNIIKWRGSIADTHNFDFTFLINAEKNQSWYEAQSNFQFEPTGVLGYHALQAGNNPAITNNDTYSTGNALMARLNYSLLDKYMLTLSWRRDGYSAFGQANPYAEFPSAAVGWILSEEDFYNSETLNYLKFRLSWGLNGNRTVGPYDALARLSTIRYIYGNRMSSGANSSSMANSQLRWERTKALNFGIDFGFFNDKINGNIEVYDMTTTDLLLNRSLPQIIGYTDVTSNLGELANKGVELSLNTNNLKNPSITWKSNFVFSFNRNKIIRLYGDMVDVLDDNGSIIGQREANDLANSWFIGQSIDRVWEYEVLGVWQVDEADQAANYGKLPGDIKLRDVNGDGEYVPADDKIFQGYEKPQYRLGLRNDFTFLNNFEFSAFIRADLGFQGINNLYTNDATGGQFERRNTFVVPYWTPDNPNNEWARLNSDVSSPSFNVWKNRSFVRLQDVTLAYNFPRASIERIRLQNLKVYINLRNYLTFTKWEHYDPESGTTPMPKFFTFGFNVNL